MGFEKIEQNTKDYIKSVLLLSEQTPPTPAPGPGPGATAWFSPTRGGSGKGTGTTVGGSSGKATPRSGTRTYPKVDSIQPDILLGKTLIPGTTQTVTLPTGEKAETHDSQKVLNYMTGLAQASSTLDVLDQMLSQSPGIKLLMANQLRGKTMPATLAPGSAKTASQEEISKISTAVQDQIKMLPGGVGDALTMVSDLIGTPEMKKNKLLQKTMQYSIATTPFEITDPFAGMRRGIELMGGKEIRKNIARIQDTQTRGAQTGMGHPSGFGIF
jgi:hypothetical protein